MPLSQSQAEHALAAVQADLPELLGIDPQGEETASVLLRLVESRPDPPNQDDRKDLDVLCREIAVAGNVFKVHDPAWKKGVAGAALPRVAFFVAAPPKASPCFHPFRGGWLTPISFIRFGRPGRGLHRKRRRY